MCGGISLWLYKENVVVCQEYLLQPKADQSFPTFLHGASSPKLKSLLPRTFKGILFAKGLG